MTEQRIKELTEEAELEMIQFLISLREQRPFRTEDGLYVDLSELTDGSKMLKYKEVCLGQVHYTIHEDKQVLELQFISMAYGVNLPVMQNFYKDLSKEAENDV